MSMATGLRTSTRAWQVTLVLVVGILAGFPGGVLGAPKLRPLNVLLDWFPNVSHLALYTAKERGYFEREGLRVQFRTPSGTTDPVKLVGTGKLDLGISYPMEVILARSKGIPVVSIWPLFQHPLNVILSFKEANIREPRDLIGKKIGSPMIPQDQAILASLAADYGFSSKDFQVVNLGFNLTQGLLSKRVDAVVGAYITWEAVEAALKGQEVNIMKIQDYGIPDYYELVIITNERFVARNGEVLRSFLKAVRKGTEDLFKDPAGSAAILLKANRDLQKEIVQRGTEVAVPLMKPTEDPLGLQGAEKWDRLQNWMLKYKLIEKKTPVEKMFTNSLLPTVSQ
ncbi:MAG: ABC transporter substrate-binding protein [Candidatus Tectomicrobia bacterium]|uniref:Thiamine pyrimidine synthase n=1 Tax=Tectimicrobiota bacterium TaxID=2528274 RepID=A0A932GLU7_UNCTE|nr:ABC transporter substrate-binding protein [Candidatus Tectomicrobia bacterium]